MFTQYSSSVCQFYELQKASGELSLNLAHPTPANLRRECLILFNGGSDMNDCRVINAFLERPPYQKITAAAIRFFDLDKFKPLVNFLKGKTLHTADKNVELLALLIDFQPRPYTKFNVASHNREAVPRVTTPLYSPDNHRIRKGYIKRKLQMVDNCRRGRLIQKELITEVGIALSRQQRRPAWNVNATNYLGSVPTGAEESQKKVVLQYPSGVRISVDATDISLISQLIKL